MFIYIQGSLKQYLSICRTKSIVALDALSRSSPPAGVEDVLKHAQMHSEAHHKDKAMTEAQFRGMIKDA